METSESVLNNNCDSHESNSSASEEKTPLLASSVTNSDSHTTSTQGVESRTVPVFHESQQIGTEESDSEAEHFEDAMDALDLGSSKAESRTTENESEFTNDEPTMENCGDEMGDDSSDCVINEDVLRAQEERLTDEEKQV